jgi:thiol-disulfide isomerase/thioredoxin
LLEYAPERKARPMITRRATLLGMTFPLLAGVASAAPARPFDIASFRAAQGADKAILVDVTASWCPTCRIQKPILARLLVDPKFADFAAFEIDFDRQKDALRVVDARMQSTLVVYRGTDEMGRSVGDTNPVSIEALLSMGL